jgi:hypothetical protein
VDRRPSLDFHGRWQNSWLVLEITRLSRWLCCRTERFNSQKRPQSFVQDFQATLKEGSCSAFKSAFPKEGSMGPFPAAILTVQRWVDRRVRSSCRGLREGPGCVRTLGNLGRASARQNKVAKGPQGLISRRVRSSLVFSASGTSLAASPKWPLKDTTNRVHFGTWAANSRLITAPSRACFATARQSIGKFQCGTDPRGFFQFGNELY